MWGRCRVAKAAVSLAFHSPTQGWTPFLRGCATHTSPGPHSVILGEHVPLGRPKVGVKAQQHEGQGDWAAQRHVQHWLDMHDATLHSTQSALEAADSAPAVVAHYTAFGCDYAVPNCLLAACKVAAAQGERGKFGRRAHVMADLLAQCDEGLPSFIGHLSMPEVLSFLHLCASYGHQLRPRSRSAVQRFLHRQLHAHEESLQPPHACIPSALTLSPPAPSEVWDASPPHATPWSSMLPAGQPASNALAAVSAFRMDDPHLHAWLQDAVLQALPAHGRLPAPALQALAASALLTGQLAPGLLGPVEDGLRAPGPAMPLADMIDTLRGCIHAGLHVPGLLQRLLRAVQDQHLPLSTGQARHLHSACGALQQTPPAWLQQQCKHAAGASAAQRRLRSLLKAAAARVRQAGYPCRVQHTLQLPWGGTAVLPLALPAYRACLIPEPTQGRAAAAADSLPRTLAAAGWRWFALPTAWWVRASVQEQVEWVQDTLLGLPRVSPGEAPSAPGSACHRPPPGPPPTARGSVPAASPAAAAGAGPGT